MSPRMMRPVPASRCIFTAMSSFGSNCRFSQLCKSYVGQIQESREESSPRLRAHAAANI
jgi:hypothetical protein